jgi:hypothetical protein
LLTFLAGHDGVGQHVWALTITQLSEVVKVCQVGSFALGWLVLTGSAFICIQLPLCLSRIYNQSLDPPFLPTNIQPRRPLIPNCLLVWNYPRSIISHYFCLHHGLLLHANSTLLDAVYGIRGFMHRCWPVLCCSSHH